MALVKHSKRTIRSGCDHCGSKKVYWTHDTDKPGVYCHECQVEGGFVLVDVNGRRHLCRGGSDDGQLAVTPEAFRGEDDVTPAAKPEPMPADPSPSPWEPSEPAAPAKPEPAPVPPVNGDAFAAFANLMQQLAPKVDRSDVLAIVREEMANIVHPTRTVIEKADGTTKPVEGRTHNKVADVITNLMGGEHVLMVGPAGTGKSTIAEQSAEALGIEYFAISLSPMTPASQILGYMQAEGEYVRSLFREAYENGGVFHFDEFDNGHPSVLAVINAALANGRMAFPDGMVKRHDDFRCVASANTYGRGADRAYVGRQQIDAATLDRFAVETIDIDESLESDLCHGTGLDADRVKRVLTLVRKLRANAADKRMTVVISPRASVGMCRLLEAGRTWDDAIEARVRRGMSDADWAKLND